MDLHNRYLHFSTVNIAFLQTINSKCEINIHHLIQSYMCEMTMEELNVDKLEHYRLLLCYEYQSAFRDIENKAREKYAILTKAEKLQFPSIKMIFLPNYSRNDLEISLLCDIIILQMILYYDASSIKQHLQNFLRLSDTYLATSDSRTVYMKVSEYLLEFVHLYELHAKNEEIDELKDLSRLYLDIIKSWLEMKTDSEWQVFALMFPKLVETFTPEHIVYPLWDHFLHETTDLKEFLTALSIMADICFTSSNSMYYVYHDIYCKSTFWLLILRGLQSPLQQYRKQALYIMKKANSTSEEIVTYLVRSNLTKAQITPFIRNRPDTCSSTDHARKTFFLVYEALEEKRDHLVMPALMRITDLIKANEEHRACDCFSIVWLQCIFEKVLLHENNHVAKWGVLFVCELDDTIFNNQFLELFITVLNNNFLYECQPDEECLSIVKKLSRFFRTADENDLLNRFLEKISRVAWGPVAIFYIIHTLRITSQEKTQQSTWQATELNAIKTLVETSLSAHSHILRTASQIELLRTIPNYVRQINDLQLLANVLATFPPGEGLTRGNLCWDIIVALLRKAVTERDVETFVREICAKSLHENASPEISPRTFAMIVCLLYDAKFIFACKTCPVAVSLNNWLCILHRIILRPYAEITSVPMYIVEFMSHLLPLLSVKGLYDNMTNFVSLYVNTTFNFLSKYTTKMSAELTYEDYARYTAIVSSHIVNGLFFMSQKEVNTCTETLRNKSMDLIDNMQDLNLQYLYALHVLYLSSNALALQTPRTNAFYTKHLSSIQTSINIHKDISANLKGKITSEYYLLLLKLIHENLVNSPVVSSWIPVAKILSNLLSCLEMGLPEHVSEIAKILTVIIDNKVISNANDRETLEHAFNLSFACIINSKKNNIFWTAMENLVEVIINNNFFPLPNAVQFAKGYIVKLLDEGENAPRIKKIILSKMKNLDVYNLTKLEDPLKNCFLHGPVYRRDQKIENYAHLFIVEHLNSYYPKHIITLNYNSDAAIRAEAVILLHRIIHPELNYAVTFVEQLLDVLEKNKTRRHFNDSPLHKLKHRIMQVLLILEPVLNKEFVSLLQEKLCDLIFSESNQSSVRIMQEWLLIRIFTKNIYLHDQLWSFFAKSIEHRPRCTISVASIVYHVAKLLPDNNQKVFIHTALPYIIQCCLGQQFSVRIYNQFILTQLYQLMKAMYGDDSVSEYKGIYQAAMTGLRQESLTKNSFRIQDDFYFSKFHPIEDYSLQTIYYELPRLTNTSCDEWISSDVFKDLMFTKNDNHPLQLYNANSFLTEAKPFGYLTKSFAGDTHAESKNTVETYKGLNDIQKKIDPTKPADLCGIFEMTSEFMFLQDTQLQEGLIVVASFVDRPPNLGGIARTCEIFGVKALVVANADCVKDKEFQFLSVSAEKWLNMLQVKPYELQKFLLDRKSAEWSLIGVEQTANSVNLMTTQFKKKTILVLGNEKDGIPANFIPLFDKCVEIPQMGVTRSLNVHVTAAICIWQYTNQHILKQ